MRLAALTLQAACLLLAVGTQARGAQAPPAEAQTRAISQLQPDVRATTPYIAGHEPDVVAILPPSPAAGSPQDRADAAVFQSTRGLAGTPRWVLAAVDAHDFFHGFGCVLGVSLTPRTAPRLFHLLLRATGDATLVADAAKAAYARPRPYAGSDAPICVEEQRAALLTSPSYPSGHATAGWLFGLMLAETAPDRADALLARARAFGESRVVCGVHYPSDVEGGWLAGAALFAALDRDPAFRADLRAAQAELERLRAMSPLAAGAAQACTAETTLAAKSPW